MNWRTIVMCCPYKSKSIALATFWQGDTPIHHTFIFKVFMTFLYIPRNSSNLRAHLNCNFSSSWHSRFWTQKCSFFYKLTRYTKFLSDYFFQWTIKWIFFLIFDKENQNLWFSILFYIFFQCFYPIFKIISLNFKKTWFLWINSISFSCIKN